MNNTKMLSLHTVPSKDILKPAFHGNTSSLKSSLIKWDFGTHSMSRTSVPVQLMERTCWSVVKLMILQWVLSLPKLLNFSSPRSMNMSKLNVLAWALKLKEGSTNNAMALTSSKLKTVSR